MDIDSFLDTEQKTNPQPAPQNAPEKVQPLDEGDEETVGGLIKLIKSNMGQKKYDVAEKLYIKAKEMFAEEAKRQQEEQNRIYSELENINREMVHGLSLLRQEAERKIAILQQLVVKANERLAAGELPTANQLYKQIDEIFSSLPEVLPEMKLKLETDIAHLHVQLSSKNNMLASSEFRTKFSNIRNLLGFALNHVQKGNMGEAVQLYHKINKLYDEMPPGFLYEKAMLYKEILKLFKAIHSKGTVGPAVAKDSQPPGMVPGQQMPDTQTGTTNADEPPPPPP